MAEKKKSFVKGALILTVAGIIVKIFGAIFRIPLALLIGKNGMAYYQAAYPIANLLMILSLTGVPTAIAKMVSERKAMGDEYAAHRVFIVSRRLLFWIGLISAIVFYLLAPQIAAWDHMPNAVYAMKSLAPALFFVAIMSAYRGYFQGCNNMTPTGASQVVEQIFRLGFGLGLAYIFMRNYGGHVEYAAAGATFGATAGGFGGMLALMFIYWLGKKYIMKKVDGSKAKSEEKTGEIIKQICIIAIPITIGSALIPIMNQADAVIVVDRLLQLGYTQEAAEGLFSQLTGYAGALINIPQMIIQTVAISLIPIISAAWKQRDHETMIYNIKLSMRLTMIIALPCAAGFSILAKPILNLLYLGDEDAIGAAGCLAILGIGVIFMGTIQCVTGSLQGIGRQLIPVRNLAIGIVFKIIITYFCVGIPSINIHGAALGTVTAYLIAATLNLIAIKKYTGVKFDVVATFIRPFATALTMAVVTWGSYTLLAEPVGMKLAVCISIVLSCGVYAVALFIFKAITRDDLTRLPKGQQLAGIYDKVMRVRR